MSISGFHHTAAGRIWGSAAQEASVKKAAEASAAKRRKNHPDPQDMRDRHVKPPSPQFEKGDVVQIGNGSQRWKIYRIDGDIATVTGSPTHAAMAGGRTQTRRVPLAKLGGHWSHADPIKDEALQARRNAGGAPAPTAGPSSAEVIANAVNYPSQAAYSQALNEAKRRERIAAGGPASIPKGKILGRDGKVRDATPKPSDILVGGKVHTPDEIARGEHKRPDAQDMADRKRAAVSEDKTSAPKFAPRFIKALGVYAVSDPDGNDALNADGTTWTRYKTQAAAQKRADKLNNGEGLDRAGRSFLKHRGVPVGGLGR